MIRTKVGSPIVDNFMDYKFPRKSLDNTVYPMSFLIYVFGSPMVYDKEILWTVNAPVGGKTYTATMYGEITEDFPDGHTLTIDMSLEYGLHREDKDCLTTSFVIDYIKNIIELGKELLLETEMDKSRHALAMLNNKPQKEYKFWEKIAKEKIQKINEIILKSQQNR